MTRTQRLARYRVALMACVALTVALMLIAVPTVWELAASRRVGAGSIVTAVVIMLTWWASFTWMWVTNERRA